MIVGNDVSQFQGNIDWNTYKDNSNFVIIRATYGVGYTDTQFFRNRDESRRVGLPRGFYHYSYPQYNTPEAEAAWFLQQCPPQEGESLYLDYEEAWGGDKVDFCKRFLDYVSNHLNGYKPLIYLNQSLVAGNDWSSVVNAGYGLWLASYQADGVGNTGQWPFMAMQQTSSTQQVPGIVGNVDRDVFWGDTNIFFKYGYHAPVPTPNPVPPPPVQPPPVENPPQPPPSPPTTTPTVDYKSYLVQIKGAVNGKGPWWSKYFVDPRLAKVASLVQQSGV